MRRSLIIVFLVYFIAPTNGQGNCNLYKGKCKEACQLSYEAKKSQGSKVSQMLFDQCIALCPTFAYAYFEKSVPFIKQGLYKEWKSLIDKAVALDPGYLLNRGCNQIQFIRNYEAGLEDLNELVELKNKFDIGYNPSGDYHAQILRAICYQKLGKVDKAVELAEELISSTSYQQGLYDYFHFGILYLEANNLAQAKVAFDKQIEENELAEIYFYYAEVYAKESDKTEQERMLRKAKVLYEQGRIMESNYYHFIDKVFLIDIEDRLSQIVK